MYHEKLGVKTLFLHNIIHHRQNNVDNMEKDKNIDNLEDLSKTNKLVAIHPHVKKNLKKMDYKIIE